ncbi:MAG: holo-ACP synthase [Chloroflexi bacterium]|nr:holo-ACP synthase [Chloroflexota bacterium]
MLAVGVDLIEVERIQASMTRYGDRFLARVFTNAERAYCQERSHQLAARFAAKEAVSKLLGVGIQHADGVSWQDIEVISDARGKPMVQLHGQAARRAQAIGVHDLALSLSHTRDHAIAMVVAEQTGGH